MSDGQPPPVTDEGIAVVAGPFNPAIVQPSWLARHGLVSEADADSAEIGMVHHLFVNFRCGPLVVQVDQQRLEVHCIHPDALPIARDLAAGIVTVLEHTPVRACGINRHIHLPGEWDVLARRLVSAEVCSGVVGAGAAPASVVLRGRRSEEAGALTLTLQRSELVPDAVYFGYNEHYDRSSSTAAVAFVRDTLDIHWEPAQRHFHDAAQALLAELRRYQP